MGNCMFVGEKVIKIMKSDGKILEYRSPIKVYEVLSEFTGHAMSETTTPESQHLRPETKLRGGQLYHLVPLPLKPPQGAAKKKKVRFSEPEKEAAEQQETSKVVRIKLVISKQELQDLLSKGGISVDDMVSRLHNERKIDGSDGFGCADDQREGCWKPVLESIAEVN